MSRGAKWLTIIVLFLIWFVWYGEYQEAQAHRVTRGDVHGIVKETNAATYRLYRYRFNVWKARSIRHNKRHKRLCHSGVGVHRSIKCAFGEALYREALAVAWCESRFNTNAVNGQFKGLFQMGESERARFGHGSSALQQARAARRYYDISGWSPWKACR